MPTRLMIVDSDAATRLRLISALSADYELVVPAPGDDPLRVARSSRPDVVLIASGGGARGLALRLCRVLKTDVRTVPAIGLYARRGEDFPSAAAAVTAIADGFCLHDGDAAPLLDFARALGRGEHPVPSPWPEAPPSPLRRALTRLLGPR
ncbi:MAG: hypothetical protein FJ102_11975 [Deltaproteobacteria bacterium]|nr:hypothetical protein [Deltaproteobacteria bacterium]